MTTERMTELLKRCDEIDEIDKKEGEFAEEDSDPLDHLLKFI